MKTITHTYTGASMNELYAKYGKGSSGFYSSDPWWKNETFANESAEIGIYEINVEKRLVGKTYKKQLESMEADELVLHPAIITEAILEHFQKTGERIFEDWYVRTSSLVSVGYRVGVGDFDAHGLNVDYWYDDYRNDSFGLASARKLPLKSVSLDPIDSSTLESRLKIVEDKLAGIAELLAPRV